MSVQYMTTTMTNTRTPTPTPTHMTTAKRARQLLLYKFNQMQSISALYVSVCRSVSSANNKMIVLIN